MEQFLTWISKLFDSWKFWIVIPPWDIGVRIRLGNNATSLSPGFHFRIPLVDVITLVNTRLRIEGTPPISLPGSKPHTSRYISASIGYRINDPLKAMMSYGLLSVAIVSRAMVEMGASQNEEMVFAQLKNYFGSDTGVTIEFLKYVENVEVRSYRLIQGQAYVISGHETCTDPNTVRY